MIIPIAKPFFGPKEWAAVRTSLESGWIVQGPWVKKFETKFGLFTKAPYAVATSSCTTALHLAVSALGLKPGDEVIVPALTWVATPNVVEYRGARPIFCDINRETFNMDVEQVESLITPKTVGLLPVHLFGLCADMAPLQKIARKHRLWIVEDAACALGSTYHGTHAGGFGDMGCFSFHPRKSITTGEGGMLITRRKTFDTLTRSLRDHGRALPKQAKARSGSGSFLPDYDRLGYNYRMTDIQGALGATQMDKASLIIKKKRALARYYDERLANLPWFKTPVVPVGYEHGYQSYVGLLYDGETLNLHRIKKFQAKRNTLIAALAQEGIETRQGTHSPPFLRYYQDKYHLSPEQFPNSFLAERLSIALPLYATLTSRMQDRVIERLKGIYARIV